MTGGSGPWRALRVAFWRKPLHFLGSEVHAGGAAHGEAAAAGGSSPGAAAGDQEMARTLGLFDLVMLGIGGTVGSGVFATAGLIASSYAGPAATLSWLVAGLGCLLSGLSFMELACLIPSAGSTYAYAYHALGELPAMLAGCLLTLEYGVSSAGGVRSWSDKFTHWLATELGVTGPEWMKPADSSVDLYAGALMALILAVVLCGMQAGKRVVNVVTLTKIGVVLFIIVVGLAHFDVANITPFVPKQTLLQADEDKDSTPRMAFGWPGVLLGASASFYGYIGYDEVCCLAGEAKNPAHNIPRAVVGTILGAATLSILATLALVGMQRYTAIDADESYGTAFNSIGLDWAASVVATGEVLTMPITSFIGFLAQPRVQYAMAKDGLLPRAFAHVDANGNLFRGTLLCGVPIVLIAIFVPFHVLWNFISLGILVAFNLTNTSLLFVRTSQGTQSHMHSPDADERQAAKASVNSQGWLIAGYLVTSFLAAFHWQKSVIASAPLESLSSISLFERYMQAAGAFVAAFCTIVAMALVLALARAQSRQEAAARTAAAKMKTRGQIQGGPVEIVLSSKKVRESSPGRGSCLQRRRSADEDESVGDLTASTSTSSFGNDRTVVEQVDDVKLDGSDSDSDSSEEAEEDVAATSNVEQSTFRAPGVPFSPCVAIFFNWFLFAQMDGGSVLLIVLWLLFALAVYFGYSRHHSLAFQQTHYHQLSQE